MHNNYYFLRQLSSALQHTLTGTVISECFSQSKDELIIRFETYGRPFFIKANVSPALSCVSCPQKVERARKNSVDLFPELIGQRVQTIRQFANERSFAICLTNDIAILFKMHGNRSNVIVFVAQQPLLFQTQIEADHQISLEHLDRKIDFSYENFCRNIGRLQSEYFTFGKWVWYYLEMKEFSQASIEQKWQLLSETVEQLEHGQFYIVEIKGRAHLMLLPLGNILKTTKDPIHAANEYFYHFTSLESFLTQKNQLIAATTSRIHSNQNYITKNREKLKELHQGHNYKIWGDLIMANLHSIPPRANIVELSDFYQADRQIEVKMKPTLSPQKNAEVYYRKAKNQQIEIQKLEEGIALKEKDNAQLEEQLKAIEAANDLRSLRPLVGDAPVRKAQTVALPYREFEFKGYKVWLGRNAEGNDELTLKYAVKDDLWLHAKDVSGSHVVIKHQSGKNFPKDVIEFAAQLAAFHSKRKTETLCPVVYTPKKFVRKRKGDPAGLVVVEREQVIMVEPKDGHPR